MNARWFWMGIPVFYYLIMYLFPYPKTWGTTEGQWQVVGSLLLYALLDRKFVHPSTETPVIVRLLKGQQQGENLASLYFTATHNESHTVGQLDAFSQAGLCKVKCHWNPSWYFKGQDDLLLPNRPTCMHGFVFSPPGGVFPNERTSSKVWCKPALNLDLLLVWSCFIQQQLLYLAFQCILNMASCQGVKA